ncbi:DNA helicase-2/ATP-dependent DNA helicase PcrA [Anoxybacillus calidus]|uniref:DNA 3'-5' helicase n=1 Tax=[Anoxybacillus] calidus TaxID=575178 RepID=A0A7W0BW83_9BACL|nr:ATP-dependent helicase [Anoxybacillus calidus]MBA2873156.1 DNA helicase-2/ATP-dependent DNA helicase PcrA [Anoxybacillus calidus]
MKLLNQFHKKPVNSKKEIPIAEILSPLTTKQLVDKNDQDEFYIRMLEQQGIVLNERQLEAVRQTEGPVLTLAGAGSGKTSVLTARVGYLINVKRIDPENILVLTFTRKAAEEMKERIAKLPGLSKNTIRNLVAGTFHSVFLQILKSQGYDHKILSNEKHKEVIIKRILKDMGLKDDYDPETILSLISFSKNQLLTVDDLPEQTPIEREFKEIFRRYEQWKNEEHYMDFDDMLVYTYHLLNENERLLERLQERFRYIEVDEFQDTNIAQYKVLQMLAEKHKNLFVVGDDDQSIYAFRGANSDIILNFPKDYPNTYIVTLDVNYRSNPSIVGLGNEIIKYNKKRHVKTLRCYTGSNEYFTPFYMRPKDTVDEAQLIVENMKSDVQHGTRKWRDFVVLYRTHAVSRAIVEQLVLKNIPFVVYGDKKPFYEHPIVKPVLDYIRLSTNPNDLNALKSILPTMYLNRDKAIDYITTEMVFNPLDDSKTLLHYLLRMPGLHPSQKELITERIHLLNDIKKMSPADAIREIRQGKGQYEKYLEIDQRRSFTLQKEFAREMLDELSASASYHNTHASYLNLIDKILKRHEEMEELKKNPYADVVSLMTIHNAKGLEFPCVYLIGASDYILPHAVALQEAEDMATTQQTVDKSEDKLNRAVEEERRLMYVAVTRAKEELYVSSPKRFRNRDLEISRFLLDVFR